ncbi:copper homeostasis protein [Reichenbachiella faecimaris]|uniref:PF03932 family protein CutC n=1 Tax=Reichenbachiella faecimaris TaxID=692418 RepID=A0A1W2GNK3_REIFA|nr:copper homeostasis protein CutC [Reichenbachiella faecimaris]SMD38235.1 copper homeostasis protein [Reichenbachiella faecimaris]
MDLLIKEACVENLTEAKNAERLGASQIELCGRLDLDGITPDLSLVEKVLKGLSIHVKVMVRPRAGNFVYTEKEINVMEVSIEFLKSMGVQEIVLGLLTDKNEIDIPSTEKLVELAHPIKVTFHKAIDKLDDPVKGVRQLMEIPGITAILTSGGKPTAREGAPVIRQMILAAEDKLNIIAAGKITNENLLEIDRLIDADAYHGKLVVGI